MANTNQSILEPLRPTLGPLLLILTTPPIVMLFWYTNVYLNGSIQELGNLMWQQGFFTTIYNIWSPVFFGSIKAWQILFVFAVSQLILMKALPGKIFYGAETPKGNIPVYKANGVPAFITTISLYLLAAYPLHLFSPTIIYDHFGELLGALNIFSLFFCIVLLLKGKYAPSSSDSGSSGNWIFDYYWGTELYPRILDWDVKMFTNCRFALMSWGLIILSFGAKQQELYGLTDSMVVAIALQFIYLAKFFVWETGYLRSLDIMHDRAGFYICWGCLVWVPGIYTSSTLYLVNHPHQFGYIAASSLFIVGAFFILVNYFADRQRQLVRETNGDCKIWGKQAQTMKASYSVHGEKKSNLLLISGWWGLARHFHYIPEILGALCWTLPALFTNVLPYFYVVFLTILLLDRAYRDDKRCANKYGNDWNKYCEKVPYKIIPFII